jgi:hypothetical protein
MSSRRVVLAVSLAVLLASPLLAAEKKTRNSEADTKALAAYRLDMGNIKKTADVTAELFELAEKDHGLEDRVRSRPEEAIQDSVRRVESEPKAMAVLKAHGLSAKDYVLTSFVWIGATVFAALDKDGTAKLPPEISRENASFVKAHKAELEPLLKKAQPKPTDED